MKLTTQIIPTPSEWADTIIIRQPEDGMSFIVDDRDMVFTQERSNGEFLIQDRTCFFRYRSLFTLVAQEINQYKPNQKVLILPGSVGCEPRSLAVTFAQHELYSKGLNPQIFVTDISENKLNSARTGTYPISFARHLSDDDEQYFYTKGDLLHVSDSMMDKVKFLPPTDVRQIKSSHTEYHTVLCLNLLRYMESDQEREFVVDNLAKITSNILCLNYGAGEAKFKGRNTVHKVLKKHGMTLKPLFDNSQRFRADIFYRSV